MRIELGTSAAAEPSRASIGLRPHRFVEEEEAAEEWGERHTSVSSGSDIPLR
jgi:hypothetical protein